MRCKHARIVSSRIIATLGKDGFKNKQKKTGSFVLRIFYFHIILLLLWDYFKFSLDTTIIATYNQIKMISICRKHMLLSMHVNTWPCADHKVSLKILFVFGLLAFCPIYICLFISELDP